MLRRGMVALGLLTLGALNAVPAVLVHQRWWGLALGLLAGTAAIAALPPRWWLRPAFAAGWMAMVTAAVLRRPEGDYLVPANLAGYAVLGGSMVLLLASLVTLPPPRRRLADQGDSPRPT